MNIQQSVLDKIKVEKKRHHWEEFGGYLIVENDTVQDIVFDVEMASGGYVKLGYQQLMRIPSDQQTKVRGWFHAHPMVGLSQLDMHTLLDLTTFWGECYTLVLQSNDKLRCIKTVKGLDVVFERPIVVKTEEDEIDIYPYAPKRYVRVLEQEPSLQDIFTPHTTKDINDLDSMTKVIPHINQNNELMEFEEVMPTADQQQVIVDNIDDLKKNDKKIKCKYCYKEIKGISTFCVHCGRKQKPESLWQRFKSWAVGENYIQYVQQSPTIKEPPKKPPVIPGNRMW